MGTQSGGRRFRTKCSFLPGNSCCCDSWTLALHIMLGTETSETCMCASFAQLYLQDLSVGSVCAIIPAGLVCGQRLRNYTCRTCLWAALAQYRQDFLWAAFAQLYLQDVPVGSAYNACRTYLWDVLGQHLQDLLHNTCRTCL